LRFSADGEAYESRDEEGYEEKVEGPGGCSCCCSLALVLALTGRMRKDWYFWVEAMVSFSLLLLFLFLLGCFVAVVVVVVVVFVVFVVFVERFVRLVSHYALSRETEVVVVTVIDLEERRKEVKVK
jgi:hypothetical protein